MSSFSSHVYSLQTKPPSIGGLQIKSPSIGGYLLFLSHATLVHCANVQRGIIARQTLIFPRRVIPQLLLLVPHKDVLIQHVRQLLLIPKSRLHLENFYHVLVIFSSLNSVLVFLSIFIGTSVLHHLMVVMDLESIFLFLSTFFQISASSLMPHHFIAWTSLRTNWLELV